MDGDRACLLASHAFQDVVRYLGPTIPTARSNPQTVPSSGAVSDARTRLGDAVVRELFTISTNHWANLPEVAELRFHGLLVAHNLVRIEMAHVAVAPGVAPTRISFHRALLVVAEGLREVTRTAPTKWPAWHGLMRSSMASLVLPERRSDRTYPRAMKMPVGRYARKLPSRV